MPKKKMGRPKKASTVEAPFPMRPPKGFRKKARELASYFKLKHISEVIVKLVSDEHERLFPIKPQS